MKQVVPEDRKRITLMSLLGDEYELVTTIEKEKKAVNDVDTFFERVSTERMTDAEEKKNFFSFFHRKREIKTLRKVKAEVNQF